MTQLDSTELAPPMTISIGEDPESGSLLANLSTLGHEVWFTRDELLQQIELLEAYQKVTVRLDDHEDNKRLLQEFKLAIEAYDLYLN